MYKRFLKYLDKDFKFVPNTVEVQEFKEELLGTLMDRDNELRQQGNKTDDEIFDECIKSIDGYKDTLKLFKGNPKVTEAVKKVSYVSLVSLCYFLVLVAAFLVVSFAVKNVWRWSWIIVVDGALLFSLVLLIKSADKFVKMGKTLPFRLCIPFIVFITAVICFLTISVFTGLWGKVWIAFLLAVPASFLADILAGYIIGDTRFTKASAVLFVTTAGTLLYVTLAFLKVFAWHPFWLIPVGSFVLSLILITLFVAKRKKG